MARALARELDASWRSLWHSKPGTAPRLPASRTRPSHCLGQHPSRPGPEPGGLQEAGAAHRPLRQQPGLSPSARSPVLARTRRTPLPGSLHSPPKVASTPRQGPGPPWASPNTSPSMEIALGEGRYGLTPPSGGSAAAAAAAAAADRPSTSGRPTSSPTGTTSTDAAEYSENARLVSSALSDDGMTPLISVRGGPPALRRTGGAIRRTAQRCLRCRAHLAARLGACSSCNWPLQLPACWAAH